MSVCLAHIEKGALFSECRTWRYALWRIWDGWTPRVMFVGLNPSTADEDEDDPTIRRCIGFAKSWGFGGIYMLNLFAFRATDPKDMKAAADPVGLENDAWLVHYRERSELAIACWGVHGAYRNRFDEARLNIQPLHCLGVTKEGQPRHPLYLRKDRSPQLWMVP